MVNDPDGELVIETPYIIVVTTGEESDVDPFLMVWWGRSTLPFIEEA